MKRALMGTAGLVLGTGALVFSGAGIASAQTASGGAACQQIESTLSSIQSTLPQAASNPSALSSKIGAFASQLGQESASASPAVKSAVNTFIGDLKAAGAGHVNVSKLTSDANAIGAACKTPSGAPATGGGSTAGVQDPVLFGLGGAALLAGVGVIGLGRRNRPRSSTRS